MGKILYLTIDNCICIELGAGKMTVGKIYAGLLIVENWRAYKDSLAQSTYMATQQVFMKAFF